MVSIDRGLTNFKIVGFHSFVLPICLMGASFLTQRSASMSLLARGYAKG